MKQRAQERAAGGLVLLVLAASSSCDREAAEAPNASPNQRAEPESVVFSGAFERTWADPARPERGLNSLRAASVEEDGEGGYRLFDVRIECWSPDEPVERQVIEAVRGTASSLLDIGSSDTSWQLNLWDVTAVSGMGFVKVNHMRLMRNGLH